MKEGKEEGCTEEGRGKDARRRGENAWRDKLVHLRLSPRLHGTIL